MTCFLDSTSIYPLSDNNESSLTSMFSFLEGARIGSGVALSRSVSEPTSINDGGVNLTLKPGQQVMCNLVSRPRPVILRIIN